MSAKLGLSQVEGVWEQSAEERIFGPKREREISIRIRELHTAELHNFYSSSDSIRVIKSSGMRLAGM
jgi:hypothetical protein